ncbi:MAG: hypothetical protein RBR41_02240 [Desulfovibrio sp.]|uniref:hypothetical protein n=1 Tax=Desulfovibrio sp. TaxID=885 RepID=UPI002A36F9DA|nr:hypothetical protein [Desulfovibrio sp.]MDY0258470.1 hypothetical protein [Desulfovibrio sp.]
MELGSYLKLMIVISLALSAIFLIRASRIRIWISGAIGGPTFPSLTLLEKVTTLLHAPERLAHQKCVALSSWFNAVGAFFAFIGAVGTALEFLIS